MRKMKIQLNKQLLFNTLFVLMLVLVFVRYGLQIDYPRAVLLIISAIMACIGNPTQILAVCMICVPLSATFNYIYALLIAIAMYVLKNVGKICFNVTIIPILLLVIWELLHGITGRFSLKVFVAMFLPYLICGLLLWQDKRSLKELNYPYIVRAYAVATCVVCITLIFSVLKMVDYNLSNAFVGIQRLGMLEEEAKLDAMVTNPNSVGIMCIMAVNGLLQLMTMGERKKKDFCLIILLLIAGMLTVSRTFMALLLIMVVLHGFTSRHSIGERIRFLIIVVIISALVIGLSYWLFPGVFEAISYRFNADDLSSGRIGLFINYNHFMLSRPSVFLFGIGLTDFSFHIRSLANFANVPHNGIQEIILAWGIIGFSIFIAFCACLITKGKTVGGRKSLINYIPFLLLFAKIQVGQMVTSDYTMLLFAYCFLSVLYDFNTKNQ